YLFYVLSNEIQQAPCSTLIPYTTLFRSEARRYYDDTIRACGDEPWYFAPNACLQMGYISLEAGDTTRAKDYFIKARKYPRHEYKNSIDSKAKSALATID